MVTSGCGPENGKKVLTMTEYIKNPLSGKLRGVTYEDGKIIDVHIRDTDDVVKVFVPLDNGVTVQEWISVKDRFPKDGRYLTVRYDQVTCSSFVDILWFERGDWWKRHYPGDYAVTHWMPLPEPPKEG